MNSSIRQVLSVIPESNISLETVEAVGAKALDKNNIHHLITVSTWFGGSMRRSLASAGLFESDGYVELENTDKMVEEMKELMTRADNEGEGRHCKTC